MKELVGNSGNIYLRTPIGEEGERESRGEAEVILILSEPHYKTTNVGSIVKERETETVRFVTGAEALRGLAEMFIEWADDLESATQQKDEPSE